MIKILCLTALTFTTLTCAPAIADENTEFPVTVQTYPFHRSYLTNQIVGIAPYQHAFRVRVYTTPQKDPYYNVPPYAVVTPY